MHGLGATEPLQTPAALVHDKQGTHALGGAGMVCEAVELGGQREKRRVGMGGCQIRVPFINFTVLQSKCYGSK